jgi:hypothetical protein
MASRFFGVTGPGHFELGFELGAHNGVAGMRVDIQVVGLLNPLTQGRIGGKTSRVPANLLPRGQHVWRERQGLAGRHVQIQQGVQAARFLAREPVADGIAVAPQERGHVPAGLGLLAGQPIEPLEPWSRAPVMVTS